MRTSFRRPFVAAIAAAAALLGAAVAPTGGVSAGAEGGGTLRVVVTAEPRSLNQAIDNNSSALGVSKLVNERLVSIDGERTAPAPGLVESWERLDDLTWELTLVEGVEFTNGEPFDADAAVYSILETRDTPGAFSAYVQTIESVEATDDYTVTLTTTQPIGFVAEMLTIVPAVPPEAYEATDPEDFGRSPIGTGPFVLDSWNPGSVMTFSRNDDYWGEPASVDAVEITWNGEAETRVALLETGEADIVKAVTPQLVERVENADGLSIAGVEGVGVLVLQANNTAPPLDDVRVRQAVAHSIDREALVNAVFSGVGATPHQSTFTSNFESGAPPEGALEYDLDAAAALLEEVGDVAPIPLYWPNGRYLLDNQVGEAIAGMLEDAGFTVERNPMEAGAYFELLLTDEMPGIHLISVGAIYPHESYPINSFFLPTSVVTYCASEDLVEDATAAMSLEGEERDAAYTEINRRLVVDEVCPIPLYIDVHNWGVSDEVSGFTPRADEMLDLASVSLGG